MSGRLVLPTAAQPAADPAILNSDMSLPFVLIQMAFVIGGAIVLHAFLGRLKLRLLAIVHQRTQTHAAESEVHAPLELFLRLLVSTARTGLWVGVALYITNLFPATRRWSNQAIYSIISSLTAPVLTLGRRAYSIIDLLILGALLFAIIILAGILTNLLRSRVLQRAGINRGLQEVIAMLTKYSVVTIATIILLQIWGLDLSSLTILASALGVGIGFGLQDIAKNFGSGLVLVFERPIQVGDFVEVGEFEGTVERIGARSTEIRTLDHVSIIVPNSRFLEKEVINWSHRNPVSRLHIPIGVTHRSDPKIVQKALLEAAQSHPDVLQSPPPKVLFHGFGDSALHFDLLVWTGTPSRQFILKSDLNFLIFEALQRWQIEIPFPQRDLHLRSVQVEPALRDTLNQFSSQSSNHSEDSQ
ncbi:mechanosensitive ion channel family protein [Leptolyngbya ohadii]|uniref:mechanosensitive ion channel family protein n=1 Tax=Leptolyngbya ohadii TaxID=1962290 RepID=UPI0021F22A08|nr:mechanosensitive ion channel domain-containing protein [Leptolyngbya ohadii]